MKIITNNHARPVINWHELTEKEQEEFDYCGENAQFFRYKGDLYYTGEFMLTSDMLYPTWEGIHGTGFCSGIVMRFTDETGKPWTNPDCDHSTCNDFVVVGLALS